MTAGISDVVFQIGQGIGHGDAALAENVLEFLAGQTGKRGGAANGQAAFAIERHGEFQMQLGLGGVRLGLQPLREVVRDFQCHTHDWTLDPRQNGIKPGTTAQKSAG